MVDTHIMWCLRVGARKALLVKSDDAARATGRRKRSLRALLGTCSSPQAGPGTRARHACSCVGRLGTSALGVGEQVRHEARGWVSRSGSRGHRRQTWRHDCVCREAEASWARQNRRESAGFRNAKRGKHAWSRLPQHGSVACGRKRKLYGRVRKSTEMSAGDVRPLWFRSACADSR